MTIDELGAALTALHQAKVMRDKYEWLDVQTLVRCPLNFAALAELVEAVKYHEHNAPIETNPCEICEKLAAVLEDNERKEAHHE